MSPELLLKHADSGALWPAAQQACLPADLAEAYQLALSVRRLREARGEEARGYKIGFTNSQIWPRYQVFGPIWGTVYSSTLAQCEGEARVSLQGAAQPRLEPEAVFGMKAAPPPNASADGLLACVDWVAPGFEIVQSHAPDWKFTAAMTVADGGLHSRLVVGRPIQVASIARDTEAFNALFAKCAVRLHKDGRQVETGQGRNVLGSPLLALQHFLAELRSCPDGPDLRAGDVVTTGTWTDAWPVAAGETWQADFDEPLPSLRLTFD